jgi:lysine 2,3-aminomutase
MLTNNQHALDELKITPHAQKVLKKFIKENPDIERLFRESDTIEAVREGIRAMAMKYMESHPKAYQFYTNEVQGRKALEALTWQDFAAIRILDYLDHADRKYKDLNLRGKKVANHPFKMLWLGVKNGSGGAQANFIKDMIHLFRQFRGEEVAEKPSREKVLEWMGKYPSGLDPEIISIREENKQRIIRILAEKIDRKEIRSPKFVFPEGINQQQKIDLVTQWWDDYLFHLRFAVRSPDFLNELLDHSLDKETMEVLYKAEKRGIPFFINPYYLSLLNVNVPEFARGKDLAIRYYILYSKQLVEEFGHIVAWEKEDIVEPGKPNAAGWILPTRHNVHRRYPEVAILIPDTMGRACGGLCASCQRMYDFQRGNLNFNLEKLKPNEAWEAKLELIMKYWEEDTRLRDILITGGDALMSADKSLKIILDAVYQMAVNKKKKNETLPDGQKHAEILRVRLGSRLLAYLPQRITPALAQVLANFKEQASKIGIKQFVIQTHFQSPMEVTPEARLGISRLQAAGWTITNQLVFTAAASRRGHSAKLRQVLNDVGVLPYYTFSVKGYMENNFKFATNARAVQEQMEEKSVGQIPAALKETIKTFPQEAENMVKNINTIREKAEIPFLATDRNVLNLPGVGKSMTYRVIGITRSGRRILEFDHDHTRSHSPIVDKIGKFVIIESKSIANFLEQLEEMGEDKRDYKSIWGYSIGETEPRTSVYEYPEFDFELTPDITNFGG